MKNDHVMSGLKAKRAEIAGKIETMQREMRLLVATIGHIDATIRTFDPSVDLEDIKSRLPPRFQAFKGEVSRILLDALREAKTPLPVYDLTLTVAASRGITTDDKPFMIILRRRVDACLRNLRKRGTVKSSHPSGSLTLWEIAR